MRTTKSAGFTLVEVIVALFLIGIGVLAAAPMFMFAMQTNEVGADIGSGGALAVERMELLRAADYADLDAGGSLTVNTTVTGVDYFDAADPDFVVRWQIADNLTPVGTKTISVRVVPAGVVPGPNRQVNLVTVRGR